MAHASAQSLASAGSAPVVAAHMTAVSAFIGPSLDGGTEESITERVSHLTDEAERLNTYLDELILGSNPHDETLYAPEVFSYVEQHLNELEEAYGDDPYFFDRYYHPQTQYLTGCHIGRAGMPIVEKVVFADGHVMANLVCRTEGAEIFYTTDGSMPTKNSPKFTMPLVLTNDKTIQAKAIRTDLEHSPVIVFNQQVTYKKASNEKLNENKIMGIYPIPDTDVVLVKYKTKSAGVISISLVDQHRQVHEIETISSAGPQFGRYFLDASEMEPGSYLIKFKFENGKTTYRQMVKE